MHTACRSRVVAVLCAALTAFLVLAGCSLDPDTRKREYLESGDRYFERGDFRAAIIEYRNAVAIDQRFGEARAKLAASYASIGDGVNALAEYVRAADLLTQDFDVQLRAGELLLVSGQPELSLARANAAVALRPADVTAHILRGNALAGLKSFDEALEAIEEAVRLDPGRGTTFTQKGFVELASGRQREAEAAFEKAVELAPDNVNGYLALGNFYWSVGRPQETEQVFSVALKIEPDHVGANRAMAALDLATGRVADAERYLRRIADTSKDAGSTLALADYYILAGRVPDAISRLTPLASASTPVPGAQQRLARAYAVAGERDKARELVDTLLASDQGNLDARLLKGQLLLAEGKRQEAFEVVRDAANAYPRSAEAQFLLGNLYAARGDAAAAETAFRAVLKINPRLASAQIELARLNLSTGRTEASLKDAEEAARKAPGSAQARLTLVRSLLATRDIARAEREIGSLQSEHPNLAEVHAQAGALADLKNDPAAARAAFDRALALDGNSMEALAGLIALDLRALDAEAARRRIDSRVKENPSPEVLLLAAQTYSTLNQPGTAETFLRRAIEADSTLLPAYAMLGQLYLSQRRLDEARKEFESLASRQSKPVAALTMSGIILQTQGNLTEARRRYAQVLEIDPRAAISANNLAWIQAESGGDLDVALQLAQTAAAAAPKVAAIADTVGWIYYKKKLPALAIPQFLRSVELEPNESIYHYHLGLAHLLAGEVDRGQADLRKALTLRPDSATSADIKRTLDSVSSAN